jgi:hypothetical protein
MPDKGPKFGVRQFTAPSASNSVFQVQPASTRTNMSSVLISRIRSMRRRSSSRDAVRAGW